jgi:N-acetylmuramoyl-L-alanine amidase
MRSIKYIFLHCTAGPQDQTIKAIEAYWKTLGWIKKGYHFMILADGTVIHETPIEQTSNGVAGYNAHAIHISYLGGVVTSNNDPVNAKGTPIDNRTPAQLQSMEKLLYELNGKFPDAIILGHRDVSPDKNRDGIIESNEWIKACPSFSVKGWLSFINFRSATKVRMMKTKTVVNIRSGPGTDFPSIALAVQKDEMVKYISEADGWIYVDHNGLKGWMSSGYLE